MGFLGSRIKELLLKSGYEVIPFLRGDDLNKCFSEHKIDAIIHTATCYGRNRESWPEISEPNLILPLRLLSLGEQAGVTCFINSDTFFNHKIKFEKNESYYVQTKKDFLDIARHALPSMKMKFFNLRIEQMYGPNDNPDKFIPIMIQKLISETESIPLTPGEQKRDLVYVDDVARAFLNILKKQHELEQYVEFGIGHGHSVSILELVTYLKEITGSTSALGFGMLPYRDNEIMDSYAATENHGKIDWKAETDWKDGLRKTVASYKK
ncbi:MAG: NAD-dependent epimerase/dehydratase [Candidatus Taylorbacteria bacterium]|nr:NAD-dependent epimerase/dehydratase [Candidatus Taylorbacteria bacterium]